MPVTDGIATALERNWDMVDRALEGMDYETMARRPNDSSNSVSWILWHMNRVWDALINVWLTEQPQLWIRDGWHEKYGMPADPDERGVGWTADQVASWQPPSVEVQLGYYAAVKQLATEYLDGLTLDDLERQVVIPPFTEPGTVGSALGQRTWDNVAHGGQIAYLRGYYQGMGWYPR